MRYLPISPAFLKLRKSDPGTVRPFRVSGGPVLLAVMAYVPMALILISIFFCAVPLSFDAETLTSVLPITVGTILCILIGELLIIFREKRKEMLPK